MPIAPFWLSGDLQALDIPGTNPTVGALLTETQDFLGAGAAAIKATADKTKSVNDRLKKWLDEQADAMAEPTERLLDATSNLLGDVWGTGVYAFLPMPDYGGFSHLRRSLGQAMVNPDDPDRPVISDEAFAGGVLVVLAGGRMQMLATAAILGTLFGGSRESVMASLSAIFTESPALQDLTDTVFDVASLPAESLDGFQADFKEWYDGSSVKHLADGGFPGSLLNPPKDQAPEPALPGAQPFDSLGVDDGLSVFERWRSLEAGQAVNALIPGATNVVAAAVNVADNLMGTIKDAKSAAAGGLSSVGSAIASGLQRVGEATGRVDDAAASFLNELTQLSAATLVISPAKGGIHQLNWALGQGLSEYALGAPLIEEDMVVAGLFLCAAASSVDEVMVSLRKFGTVFGIRALEAL